MSSIKGKVKGAVDSAPEANRKAGAAAVDKAKGVTHASGKKTEHSGKEV